MSLKTIVNISEGLSSDGSGQESLTTVRLISRVGRVNLEAYISAWRVEIAFLNASNHTDQKRKEKKHPSIHLPFDLEFSFC